MLEAGYDTNAEVVEKDDVIRIQGRVSSVGPDL